MVNVSQTLIRLATALVPMKSARKRLRKHLLEKARDARLRDLLPGVRARYESLEKKCRAKLARGERLKVAFVVCDASMFSAESVYLLMRQDPRFDCFVAVVPRVSRGETFLRNSLEKTLGVLRGKYGDDVRSMYDPESRNAEPLAGCADLVFTSIVYQDQTLEAYTAACLSQGSLLACISYGYSGTLLSDIRRTCRLPEYALFWKLFLPSERTVWLWRDANPFLEGNLEVGGYSKMDRLTSVPIHLDRPKTVLICPHHTLARPGDGSTSLSNFLRYADFFLDLPKLFPEVHFVFRPHPLLFPRLATREWWGEEKTRAYREKMERLPNVEFQCGGDYFETFANSDAMVHDCGSFLAEYFYTGRPQCFLLESPEVVSDTFTVLGRSLLANTTTAFSEEAVVTFIRDVVVGGNDPAMASREAFSRAVVCPYHPHAAQRVMDVTLSAISGKRLSVVPRRVRSAELFARTRRFDVISKVLYAQALVSGEQAAIADAEVAYLEVIRASNGFWEKEPPKRSPEDYVVAFHKTLSSIVRNGYLPSAAPMMTNGNLEIQNGAHRLAACFVSGCDCIVVPDGLRRPSGNFYPAYSKGFLHPSVAVFCVRGYVVNNLCARILVDQEIETVEGEGFIWYEKKSKGRRVAVASFPDGCPEGLGQSREQTLERLEEFFSPVEMPRWRLRAWATAILRSPLLCAALWYGGLACLRRGKKKMRAQKHARMVWGRICGLFALARFVELKGGRLLEEDR